MFGLFHKSGEKTLSEKGLLGVLEYTNKLSRDVAQLADNNRVSANNLMSFGCHLGDDLTDVTQKMGHLLIEWSNIIMEFSEAIEQYRETLISISTKEAILQPGRDQKRKLKDNIERLQSSFSSMDKVNSYKEQLEQLEKFTEPDEIEMSNFKRIATREALYLLLNGMHAMASKTDIISTFGKYIVDELDVQPVEVGQERPQYLAEEKTKRIEEDTMRAIAGWRPDRAKLPPVPTKYNALSHDQSSSLLSTSSSSRLNDEKLDDTKQDVPDRTVSLLEENKQYSFYKPDDVVEVAAIKKEEEEEAKKEQASEQTKNDEQGDYHLSEYRSQLNAPTTNDYNGFSDTTK